MSDKTLQEALKEESERFATLYKWLEESMPPLFFEEVPKEWITLIVHSLVSFKVQDFFSRIHVKKGAIVLCLDPPGEDTQILEPFSLYGIESYTTYISQKPLPHLKERLRIATLFFTEVGKESEEGRDTLSPAFLRKLPKEQHAVARTLFEKAKVDDLCQYEVQPLEGDECLLLLAWKNTPRHNFLYRLAHLVKQHGLSMRRVNATYSHPYKTDSVFSLSMHLLGKSDLTAFLRELVLLKYFGSQDLFERTFIQPKLLSGEFVHLLRTLAIFVYQVLVHVDPNLYTLEAIQEGICSHPDLALKLCSAFEARLHPQKHNLLRFEELASEFKALASKLDTGHEFHDIPHRHILLQGMNFIAHILKTNFYLPNKSALSFRLDPRYLDAAPFDRKKLFPELPFGIFFVKGMHFFAFHIRFKDLSRGGVRTVFPEKREKMLAERGTIFTECYQLAYTQHKKNKDIPEGGSKCVIFLKPNERLKEESDIYAKEMERAGMRPEEVLRRLTLFNEEQRLSYLYETQRSFIRALLSLINCTPDGLLREPLIVDLWKRPEDIYLGPDENMHNVMIEWIAVESRRVQYRPGGAFISGKRIGINHKEYGVTSLGVNVYVEEVLKYLGIDPYTMPFTVKMTGGPDGDVAGNEIRNLYHFYPKTAKLVALTDGSGTIYDPQGLDLALCHDLFLKGLPIGSYQASELSEGGFLLIKEKRRELAPYAVHTLLQRKVEGEVVEEWLPSNETNLLLRNNVHQVLADIFIPCGGRPRTLRENTYKEFLDAGGRPTARAIVEGANLYLSAWARHYLEEKGTLIIKDSSANKCGVICSSFEILAGLTLTDEQFLQHKERLVKEILERLHAVAYDEAKLLLSTLRSEGGKLTEISEEISRKINLFTDELLEYLEGIELSSDPSDPLLACFIRYALPTLQEHLEALLTRVPENHKKAVIASYLAARAVYTRGLHWSPRLVDILPLLLQELLAI